MRCGGSHRAFLALLLTLAAGCGSDWPEYAPEGGRYKVRMPGTPSEDKDPDLPEGVHKVSLSQRSGNYAVAYQDLPEGGGLSVEERLDRACDGALRSLKATEVSRKAIQLQGEHPGRELVAEYAGGTRRVRGRLFLVGRRLYQVLATGQKWWVESGAVTRFLDS